VDANKIRHFSKFDSAPKRSWIPNRYMAALVLRRRRQERGEERQLASETNTTKRHAHILSREILFSNLGAT